ncbi:MAG: preprotein translocase subunit SecG [Candidatus Omnitrophota bacterium]
MYVFLIVVHVIISIFLIAVILLQAGRGGGLADSFGGSQMQSLFGTKSTNVLTRMTGICAVIFILTCLSLAIISSHMSRSLMEKLGAPEVREQTKEVEAGQDELEQPEVIPISQETQGASNETESE